MMNKSSRKISGGFDASFQLVQGSLIINITHPLKNRVYFSRLSDHNLPKNIVEIADTAKQLYELIIDLNEEKLIVNANDALVIMMDVGKKVKEYSIPMQIVDISMEEALKKRVEDLEKELAKKQFQAKFYKEQYIFLLEHLQLKPDIEQLQKIYQKDIGSFFSQNSSKLGKSQSMFEKESDMTMSSISAKSQKVGSAQRPQKQQLKCLNLHPLKGLPTQHPYYCCNVCRKNIAQGNLTYRCTPCDFDVCGNCIQIPPQNRIYCPKQHAIEFGTATTYLNRRCDLCAISLAFTKGYTCGECDYDICKTCLK